MAVTGLCILKMGERVHFCELRQIFFYITSLKRMLFKCILEWQKQGYLQRAVCSWFCVKSEYNLLIVLDTMHIREIWFIL